jgi:hypothetical protein
MAIRLRSRKYALSLAEVANRTGESLSSIKRQSAKNPAQFAAKVQRLMNGAPEPTTLEDRLARLTGEELLAMAIHFALPRLSDDARAVLAPILEITREIIEEASEKMGRRAR